MEEYIKNLRIKDPNKLLEVLNIKDIPDIAKIIKACGIKIKAIDSYKAKRKLETYGLDSIMGVIHISNNLLKKEKVIFINDELPANTQRFIAAYLFSGYQLNGNDDKEYWNGVWFESRYDREIYKYTLDLLIPDKIFNDDLEQIKSNNVLAKRYNVSEVLIEEKIKIKARKERNLKVL